MSIQTTATRRRKILAASAVALAIGGTAIVRTPAEADTVKVNYPMTIAGIGDLGLELTTTDTPDPAMSGGTIKVVVDSKVTPPAVPNTKVKLVKLTIPIPTGAEAAGSVTFSGGNFDSKEFAVEGRNLKVTFTSAAGIPTDNVQTPTITINGQLTPGFVGTINWVGPSQMDITANLGGTDLPLVAKPKDGNPFIQTTKVIAPGSPDTAPGTTAPTTPTTKGSAATTTTTMAGSTATTTTSTTLVTAVSPATAVRGNPTFTG